MKALYKLHFIIGLSLILHSTGCFSQSTSFVGLSESQIRTLLAGKVELKADKANSGDRFLVGINGAYSWAFYLDEDNICYALLIIPEDAFAMNGLVKYYNDRAVAVSATEWRMYTKARILNIKLTRIQEGDPKSPLSFFVSIDEESK